MESTNLKVADCDEKDENGKFKYDFKAHFAGRPKPDMEGIF